ncbi:MAG: hypothetical protein HY321_18080 [Armatimonadetes bacterium]|nr:hypothetical protein [Armatimonadota bacterium]
MMSVLQADVDALRREVAELRAELQAAGKAAIPSAAPSEQTGRQSLEGSPQDAVRHYMHRRLTDEAAKKGASSMGVFRIVGFHRDPEFNTSSASEPYWFDAASLPPEQTLVDLGAALNPIAVRAFYDFIRRFFEEEWWSAVPKMELSAALAVSESDLEDALRPAVASGMVQWGKRASGEEFYALSSDRFILLLAIVQPRGGQR